MMKSQDLKDILTEVSTALADNKRMVTSDLLDQVESLLPLLQAINPQTLAAAATATKLKSGPLDLNQLITVVKTAIQHERTMIGAVGDKVSAAITTILNRPVELELLSKLL